jgi:hypothetical protein
MATLVDWQKVRQELKDRRTQLFDRFVKNPGDVCLAIEIRRLDDQVLDCAEHLRREQDDHKPLHFAAWFKHFVLLTVERGGE